MIPATTALERLIEGNRRFASEEPNLSPRIDEKRRAELLESQAPFAIILGCSDSRVPVDLIFDQGLGDLFVVRIAGNVAAPSPIGSVEYAAQVLGTRLVVVLGHTQCGAVKSTIAELQEPSGALSPGLHAIVDQIEPTVKKLLNTDVKDDAEVLVSTAIRANVRASVDQLQDESEILKNLIENEELLIVGAQYDLQSGLVEFFDGVPEKS